MMIVLLGKTASGKDSIVKKLISLYGFKRIITYSSRPIRKGEIDGIDYYFVSKDEFKQKIDDGFFAEWKSYKTVDSIWYYGTALKDLENAEDNSVIILTPDGFREVKDKLGDNITSIYIYTNNSTIKKRLIERGDETNEAERRLESDNKDFKGFENEVDKIVYNNDGTDINNVIEKILQFVEKETF